MASAAQGHAAVPPLSDGILADVRRLVLPVTCSAAARYHAEQLSDRYGLAMVEVPVVAGTVVIEPTAGDLLVHSLPDVFGRLLPTPGRWRTLAIRDHLARDFTRCDGPVIDVGEKSTIDASVVLGALRNLFKPLAQTRGVRAVFDRPPPLGLPFVAPGGIVIDGEFGLAEPVAFPGLPDLVVVRPGGRGAG
jgi:hypothetical protein